MRSLGDVADVAMNYLDSVSIAADYEIKYMHLIIYAEEYKFSCAYDDDFEFFIKSITSKYPQKSPD